MKSFYKSKPIKNTKSIHDCHKSCKKDDADLVYFNTDNKGNYCECLNKVSKKDSYDTILDDISDKKYKVNQVAFWVTFSFFILFMLVLLYFFIQIFFIKN